MKKALSLTIVLAIVTSLFAAFPVAYASGNTEENLFTYAALSDETIAITGYNGELSGDVVIPSEIDGYSVTKIGDWAFYGLVSLESITIPDSVTTIGFYAFYECTLLTNISIGNNVASVGSYAFYSTAHYAEESNWENGVLYIGNVLIKADEYKLTDSSYEIKSGTKTIADFAFSNCSSLTDITIPESVTNIGEGIITGASSFTDLFYVGLESDWSTVSVDDCNDELLSATMHYLKGNCGNNLTWALSDGTLTIRGAGDMWDFEHDACDADADADDDSDADADADESLSTPWNLKQSTIKTVVIADGVTSVGNYAFFNCKKLLRVDLPDTLTRLGQYSFTGCRSLKEITIPDSVSIIRDGAFGGCKSLVEIAIPDGVTSIGGGTFSGCNSLSTVKIPNGVTIIGQQAFCDCYSLTRVTIPLSVTVIDIYAFADCTLLTDVYYGGKESDKDSITIVYDNGPLTNATWHYATPATGIIISDTTLNLFVGDTYQLTAQVLPENATNQNVIWSSNHFAYCSVNQKGLITAKTPGTAKITVTTEDGGYSAICRVTVVDPTVRPTGVTLSDTALTLNVGDTYQLTANVLPEDATNKNVTWSTNRFAYCSVDENGLITAKKAGDAVVKITVTTEDGGYSAICRVTVVEPSEFTYTVTSAGAKITGYGGTVDDEFTVPATVDNNAVAKIGSNAFAKKGFTSVIVEYGLKAIDYGAFAGCANLESITIPISVTAVGNNAFSKCTNLTDVYYGGTEDDWNNLSIGTNNECLTDATVHFTPAAELLYVATGANAKITGYDGIMGTTLDIPSTIDGYKVTKTASNVFFNCKLLRVVTIGPNLTTINYGTFSNCKNMRSIVIPKTVKIIGSAAFKNCNSLTDVYYLGSEAGWANISIASGNTALTNANIHFAE